ncbi:MAG: glycosyl transferase group 1 [Acidobacteria bacterium]|nr:glycosyl transferase group 1 [Acidobacteriota bacterium]
MSPYFPPAQRYGGPPAAVLGLCRGLQRAGVDVEVVTTTADGPDTLPASPPEQEFDGVPVHYAARGFPRRFFGGRVRQPLAAALQRADICHIHGIWNVPEWWASHLARAARRPYVISPRGMLQRHAMNRGRWRKAAALALLDRRNLRGSALLHATSRLEADAIRALELGVPIAVVPNGVDFAGADAPPRPCRARLGIPADAFVVLFLGRMHRIKRLDLLADAFAAVAATHPQAHLVLAGPDEEGLIAGVMRRLSSVAGRVHAIGPVYGADKWALLRDAGVMVQCSDSESFGIAVAESLAAGVPVIATRTCPWAELESRDCGFWVDQTAPAIAAAMVVLADDPVLRAGMGERGAAFAREQYRWDAIAVTMRALYAGAVAGAT